MAKRIALKTILPVITLILLLLPGTIAAQNPLASPEVYQLFLDWLGGKSMALITFDIEPVDEAGSPVSDQFKVFIHNFTRYESKRVSERIEARGLRHSMRIWRLLNIFNEWEEHEYTIVLYGREHFGAKLVRVKPEKPIMEVKVRVTVSRVVKPRAEARNAPLAISLAVTAPRMGAIAPESQPSLASSSCIPWSSPLDEEVKTVTELTKAIQVHTINGLTVYVEFSGGNYLYFSQKARPLWFDSSTNQLCFGEWGTTGDKATLCINDASTTPLSNGESRWLCVPVNYKYERWLSLREGAVYEYYELITPVNFVGWEWGEMKSCPLCGSQPSGNYGWYPRGAPTPIKIYLGPGLQRVETVGAKVSFTVGYGSVSVSIELWMEVSRGMAAYPPKLVISNIQWMGDKLYAFDGGSEWKIVYFTWG